MLWDVWRHHGVHNRGDGLVHSLCLHHHPPKPPCPLLHWVQLSVRACLYPQQGATAARCRMSATTSCSTSWRTSPPWWWTSGTPRSCSTTAPYPGPSIFPWETWRWGALVKCHVHVVLFRYFFPGSSVHATKEVRDPVPRVGDWPDPAGVLLHGGHPQQEGRRHRREERLQRRQGVQRGLGGLGRGAETIISGFKY